MSARNPDPVTFEELRRESLRALREALGGAGDVTYFRGLGNLGDALIQEGTARVLESIPHRTAPMADIPFRRGATAVLSGGGAWCAAYHEIMPHALREAERRFDRVVLFPSSFDVSVPAVRSALEESRALVFARERESHRQIRALCTAELALDAAFFFDFEPWRRPGRGVLDAFRADAESAGGPVPEGNRDISLECATLAEWLDAIASHETVRTDRAHVMIAGAALGKRVEFRSSAYHKLPAIAEYALREFPVVRLPDDAPIPFKARWTPSPRIEATRRMLHAAAAAAPPVLASDAGDARVTVVLLSWNARERTRRAIASLREHVRIPWKLCLVDNGSRPDVAAAAAVDAAEVEHAEVHRLPENLGCAGGRAFGIGHATTEYVAFLDNDAEIFPNAIEHLVAELDRHPEALAATALVLFPDGRIHHFGGRIADDDPIARFELGETGRPFDPAALPVGGPCDWVPGTCAIFRRSAFDAAPLDAGMRAYFEDNEWSWRAGAGRPGAFRRCAEALVLHDHEAKLPGTPAGGATPSETVGFVKAIARFYALHGRILDSLFLLVPQLRDMSGRPRVGHARLFLELAHRDDSDAFVLRWIGGGLSPLLEERDAAIRARDAEIEKLHAELLAFSRSHAGRIASAYWRLRSRLARRPRR